MVNNLNPVLIDLGIIKIHWYSLAYIFGILIGWWYGRFLIKKKVRFIDQENYIKNFDDLISYIIIGVIIGGRLGYVIFYNPSYFIESPIQIFKLWEGGMSFHGGLIGVIVSTYIFSNLKIILDFVFFLFNNFEPSIGAIERAVKVLITIVIESVIAISLNNVPLIPPINNNGANVANKIILVEIIAKITFLS